MNMVIISIIISAIIAVLIAIWMICYYMDCNDIVIARIKRSREYDKYPVLVNKNALFEHVEKFDNNNGKPYYREVTVFNLIKFILQEHI